MNSFGKKEAFPYQIQMDKSLHLDLGGVHVNA